MKIRYACRRDLEMLCDTEELVEPYPWDDSRFADYVGQQNEKICMVTEVRGYAVAHVCYILYRKHIECTKLVVRPGFQRQGIGTSLLDKLKSKMSSTRRYRLEIPVRERNLYGQKWLAKRGLKAFYVANELSEFGEPTYWFEWEYGR